MVTREICKLCHNVNRVGFTVPNNIWNQVVYRDFRNEIICLNCFTYLGDLAEIQWDKEIEFYPVSLKTFNKE